jgi:hypothetical protein
MAAPSAAAPDAGSAGRAKPAGASSHAGERAPKRHATRIKAAPRREEPLETEWR